MSDIRTPSLLAILKSPRLLAVTVQSFSSGLPLGLVTMAIPTWAAMQGCDIKTVGILTAAQLPYSFKFVWSPVVDRVNFPFIGGKRGWIFAMQLLLALLTFGLASVTASPKIGAIAALSVLIALSSATQDIAVDAYAVESLGQDEQAVAVGGRTAIYRAAMWLTGTIAISLGDIIGWGWTFAAIAALFLLSTPSSFKAPPPKVDIQPPSSLMEAILEPFRGFFRKPRALEIVAFLLLYKIADNVAVSLVKPFLVQKGFDGLDVGLGSGTLGLTCTLAGTFLGGLATGKLGLGRSLWLFGILQAFGDTGYGAVAFCDGPSRPLLYGATVLDTFTSGLGTGAFMVFLLRITAKRFSATQYALFSSMFALGRSLAGPLAGCLIDAMGWTPFFLSSVAFSIPGLVMLHRFVPWGTRELPEEIDESAS